MKQGILPLIPADATEINDFFSVFNDGVTVTWFYGLQPIRIHAANDHATQRLMMAFLCCHGGTPQARIAAALGVHENTVMAAVARYRKKGEEGFHEQSAVRGAAVMTPEILEKCRSLLAAGESRAAVAAAAGVKRCNIDKAIQKKRLPPSIPRGRQMRAGSVTRSERAGVEVAAASALGMACVRTEERALAACGMLAGAESRFEESLDLKHGGVLCALPALAANGLLEYLPRLCGPSEPGFYYTITQVFILLALMSLLRIKSVESLRRGNPGEFGALLGLDRIPEVRCLRERLELWSSSPAAVSAWADALSRRWMEAEPALAGTLYVDGHVRVYHGGKTALPRRYAATRRLCLRGVTDYWVNDSRGNPFFYIDRPVDDGLLSVLRAEIVPRLLRDVPNQPAEHELVADRRRCRFRLVFDRAGCSAAFLAEMWRTFRIACLTYLKNPEADWPEGEFQTVAVTLADGQREEMELAERGVWFGGPGNGLWCREFRRLRRGKHGGRQTAIVSTDYQCALAEGAPAMFARWGQENFFRYMLAEFGLDLLADHATEVFPCRIPVVNPAWRELDGACRSLRGKIAAAKTQMADLVLKTEDMEPGKMARWTEKKTAMIEEIAGLQDKLDSARAARREQPRHIPFEQLPPEHQFQRLAPTRKLLLDTVRMIAYRAETALAVLARPALTHPEEARAMIGSLFNTSADLHPDPVSKELLVVLHPLSETRQNRMAESILAVLNEAAFVYPGTELRMVYRMLALSPPPGG